MPYLVKNLDVGVFLLSEFEANGVLDEHSVEEILVGGMPEWLQNLVMWINFNHNMDKQLDPS